MSTSAGAADAEMEIITNSISYKLNALKETGTGIWQNLFQRSDMGAVLDGLTGILGVFDAITDKIGLVGTLLVGGTLAKGIMGVVSAFKDGATWIGAFGSGLASMATMAAPTILILVGQERKIKQKFRFKNTKMHSLNLNLFKANKVKTLSKQKV